MKTIALILCLFSSLALAQGITIKGGATSNLAETTPSLQLRVTLAYDGGSIGPAEMKSGGPIGANRGPNVIGIGMQRLATEEDDLLFYDPVDSASTINTNLWEGASTTMTVAQTPTNGIRFNSGSSTSLNVNVRMSTIQPLPYTMASSLLCRWRFRINNTGQLNQQIEVGMMDVTGTAAPTTGSFFRWNNAGNFVAVVSQNSTEIPSASLTAPTANVFHTAMVLRHADSSEFFIDDLLVATIGAATTDPNAWDDDRVNFAIRDLIAGSAPGTAPIYDQGSTVCYGTVAALRDYQSQLVGIGRGSYQSPTTTGTFGQTANWTNNTAPAAAGVCCNTTPPATTLGGLVRITPTTTADNDCELFAYTVPVDVQLFITGVWCDSVNLGAANPATVLNLLMGVAVNSSADSLATADALGPPATAWAPRRESFGSMRYAASAAIGDAPTVNTASSPHPFSPALVIDGGRRFHIFARTMQTQTATASQVIYFNCGVSGWFQ